MGGALDRYAAEQLKAKKIAVIDDRSAYDQGLAQEFIKSAKSKGVEIVAQLYTTDKATGFNAILTAIRVKKPDTVFFGGTDAVAGISAYSAAASGCWRRFPTSLRSC